MPNKMLRRDFLLYLVAAASAACSMPKHVLRDLEPESAHDEHWLSFSNQKGVGPWLDETTLIQQHSALHMETVLPASHVDPESYQNIVSILKKVLADHGIHWRNANRIVLTYQHYGLRDTSIHSKRLLSYAKLAQEYLYSQVDGLMDVDLSWDLLGKQRTRVFNSSAGYKGLVGKYTYLVYRANAENENNEQIHPGIVNIMPVERAINYIIDDDDHKPIGSTIYIIHGPTSLITPFTELIHLTTHQPTRRIVSELVSHLGKGDANMVGRIYGESISEAAGVLMALSFLQEYGRPEAQRAVESVSKNIIQYPLLQGAMAYMRKVGVQEVLNAYTDNPREVIKTIKKIATE